MEGERRGRHETESIKFNSLEELQEFYGGKLDELYNNEEIKTEDEFMKKSREIYDQINEASLELFRRLRVGK